jgi:GDPmannose 4,6-dehydratase
MSRALITGCNGQDGAYLTKFLYERGYDVIGIARKRNDENFKYLGIKPPSVYFGDVSEPEFIKKAISETKPDEIYNLAAQSHVGLSFTNPITTMNVNYNGLVNIINVVKGTKTKIYQAGTSEMYGYTKTHNAYTENDPFRPKSPYAISKVAAHYAGINARKEGVWVSNGILFNHESPIRGSEFVTRKITLAKARGEKVKLGNVLSQRDWGFAGDYVEGMWKMLQHEKPDDFVLATGKTHSVLDFLKEAGCEYETSEENLRPNDVEWLRGDYRKAKERLGWEPKTGFKGLVSMMVEADLTRAQRHSMNINDQNENK